MAYGNVTPPTLPTYDAETNGFYLLVFNYELGAENWYMVHLIYGAWRFQYEEGVGITNTGNTFTRTYSDGVWSEESQNTVALALNPGTTGNVYQRIYTNANIFNGDELWLAENAVTPLDEEQRQINMKSQLAGFLASWVSRVRQLPKREPVAFLYGHVAKEGETPTHTINGVGYVGAVFPKMPVFPNEYEYGVITNWDGDGDYRLIISKSLSYFDGDSGDRNFELTDALAAKPTADGTGWSEFAEHDSGSVLIGNDYISSVDSIWLIWTKTNLLWADGTIALAHSDAIPIYE